MLPPAAALACGSLLAFHLSSLPIPLWIALAVFGLAFRRPAGVWLAFFAFGVLAAAVRLGLPERPLAGVDLERPVEAVVRIEGHWVPDAVDGGETRGRKEGGWSAPARIRRLKQDVTVSQPPVDLAVHIPGTEEPPPYGSTLRMKGYLSRSPGFANRATVPPGPWRLHVKSRLLLEVEEPPGLLSSLSGALRRRVDRAYAAAGPADGGTGQGQGHGQGYGIPLARALALGDASGLPLAWKRGLRLTGIYHLTSVSSLHVALVAGAVWLLAGWLPRGVRLLLMLAAILLYLLLAGPFPPLVRSAVMGVLAVLALLAERPPSQANGLAWAVILLVLDSPEVVLSTGFQLTVSATVGLLVVAPPLAERWRKRLHPWLAAALAASAAAQLLTLPWALPRFYTVAPLAPLLNLPAVPWTGLALGASLLWTAAALVSSSLAAHLLPVLDAIALPFSWPGQMRPEVWLSLPALISPAAAWGVSFGCGLLLFARPERTWVRAVVLAAALLCIGGCLWGPATAGLGRGPELAMLDVGQGDSILLRDGSHAILIDGGGWDHGDLGGHVLLPALLGEGVRHLDALVMTHPDHDHCAGLVDIAAYIEVREVWMGPGWEPEGCAGQLMSLPGTRLRLLWRGRQARVGRWRLTALHPELEDSRGLNDRSLVLRAEVFGRSVLLTGDMESWAESRVLDCCERQARVDVLKVAHHGSKTSSTESFLDAVAPRLALISAGVRNLYHHPSPAVLDRLERHGARVLRTDRDGLVLLRFSADGRTHLELPGEPR
jgi:competence protein ComEC